MISLFLTIAPSQKGGRGVFTTKNIAAKIVIEISPVIVMDSKDRALIEKTKLSSYIFEWGVTKKLACVALGYISLYNHDYSSNCEYEMDFKYKIMTIRTTRKIKKGEELCINYNADPNDKTELWFKAK